MTAFNPEIWHLIIGVLSLLLGYFVRSRGISLPGFGPAQPSAPPLLSLLRDQLGQQKQQDELLQLLRDLLNLNGPAKPPTGKE
jgi:hypothetical protein